MAPELSGRARFLERISANDSSLRLYAILDAESCDRRGLAMTEVARAWRDAGVALVQYRDKRNRAAQILRNALQIRQVFSGGDCFLILNDSVELAVEAGFDGVHLGQGDGDTGEARSALGPDRILGRSTHTIAEVQNAANSAIDYLGVGPILSTRSKSDAEPAVGLEGLRRARALTRKPLVGIGGITLSHCARVRAAGADCIATISALLESASSPDLTKTARDFLAALK